MENEILILEVKFIKSSKLKDPDKSLDGEPNWKSLGLRNPTTGKYEDEKDDVELYEIEFGWRNKTIKKDQIISIEELFDNTCLFILEGEECIIKIGFKEALKLIYNKE